MHACDLTESLEDALRIVWNRNSDEFLVSSRKHMLLCVRILERVGKQFHPELSLFFYWQGASMADGVSYLLFRS